MIFLADRFDHIEIINAAGRPGELQSMLSIFNKELNYYNENPPEWAADVIEALTTPYGVQWNRNPWDRGFDEDEGLDEDYRPRFRR